MTISAQLFTLRDYCKTFEDFEATLGKLKNIGYKAVQLSAVACVDQGDLVENGKRARDLLDKYGIVANATHRPWESFIGDIDREIAYHQALGCSYTAIAVPSHEHRQMGLAGYQALAKESHAVVETLGAAGIRFAYHNHAFEWQKYDGKRGIDVLIDETPHAMQIELDTYWAIHAGAQILPLIERLKGRLDMVHLKDKESVNWEVRFGAVGEGNIDWEIILPALAAAGTTDFIVEQDDTFGRDPFEALESSLRYLEARTHLMTP